MRSVSNAVRKDHRISQINHAATRKYQNRGEDDMSDGRSQPEKIFDTPESINKAIHESLKQTSSIKITDMTGGVIIARLFLGLGNNAEERSLSDEDMALVKQHLDLTRFEEIKYRKAVPRNPLSPLPPVARMQGESQARELMSKTFYPPSAPPHHE